MRFCLCPRCPWSVRLNVGYVRLCRPRGSGESVPALSVFILLSLESKSFSVLLKLITAEYAKTCAFVSFQEKRKPSAEPTE
nr:hypothetical protein MALGBQGM_MALGBQGM_CDS_0006 [Microvirus sp.]